MYVATLNASGYRNLDGPIRLAAPLAVIVGENNVGKSNVIDALRTVLEPENPARGRCWLRPEDFTHDGTGQNRVDELELAVRLEGLDGEAESRMVTCLAPDDGPGVAKLRMKGKIGQDGRIRVEWFGGNSEHADIDRHAREAIRFVYLHPLRDAAADLRPGRDNKLIPLLSALTPETHPDRAKIVELLEKSNAELDQIDSIVKAREQVNKRLGAMTGQHRFRQHSTLAFDDPVFTRIVGSLRAKIGELVPLEMDQNGLGFNNLLYMAVLLAAMAESGEEDQDPALRVMLIEEPEAHLHPQLQDLLMRFIEDEAGGGNQVIVTSNSPNFASSARVSRLTVMSRRADGGSPAGHVPGAFGLDSKHLDYLRRFLDVTKASLFFARGVVLVEGVAEQLLVPAIAKRFERPLAEAGVSVINIGGVAFQPFTELFGPERLPYRLAAISDSDPRPKGGEGGDPEELVISPRAEKLQGLAEGNIGVFLSGHTLEWDMAQIPANRPILLDALTVVRPQLGAELAGEADQLSDEQFADKMMEKISDHKGEFAQVLAELVADPKKSFEAPEYLRNAICWVVEDSPSSEEPDAS